MPMVGALGQADRQTLRGAVGMNGVNPKITILEADVCKTTEVRCLRYSSQSAILSREWEQESSRFSTQEGRPSAFPGRGSHAGHLSEPAQRVGCVGKGAGARRPCSALPHWPARPPSRPLSRGEQGTPPSTSLWHWKVWFCGLWDKYQPSHQCCVAEVKERMGSGRGTARGHRPPPPGAEPGCPATLPPPPQHSLSALPQPGQGLLVQPTLQDVGIFRNVANQ